MLTTDELCSCGFSREAIKRRARNGGLHRVHHRVFAVGHDGLTREGRWLAAVKACGPDAVLSFYSAAAHWGFVKWDDRRPEVTVPGSGTRQHQGIRVHRSASLDRQDMRIRDSIPVTAPARTLLDLAAILPYWPLRRAVREAMALRRVAIRHLVDVLARRGPCRGSRSFARIIADGYTPTESVLSDIVLDLILAGGFERPEVSKPLILDSALLEAHGHHVIHVTWHQAVAKQQQTLGRIEAAGAPLTSRAAKNGR